jgi:Sortase domain
VRRISGWLLPLLLAATGVTLIILGQLDLGGEQGPSLAPIPQPTSSAVAVATPSPTVSDATPSESGSPTPTPSPTPLPADVTAVQLDVPAVGISVLVRTSPSADADGFPPSDAAYILSTGSQPGQNTNSFIFAHALGHLFKPLWNVQIGDEVRVLMSNGAVLTYRISEVRPNVPCPDPDADPALNPPNPPLVLQRAEDCAAGFAWTLPTERERLTLQTSQGYNRNWGELVIVAEPTST